MNKASGLATKKTEAKELRIATDEHGITRKRQKQRHGKDRRKNILDTKKTHTQFRAGSNTHL